MARLSVALLMVGMLMWTVEAHAQECDPRSFMIQNISSIQQSGETELAFVLTSSREEFETVKKSGGLAGSYNLISGSANYDEAKQKAEQIAQSIRFDYRQSYASSIFLQAISPLATAAYSECLNKNRETPGLALWFEKMEGDYVTLRAFWIGRNVNLATAEYDEDPVVGGGEIVAQPRTWTKAKAEKIVVKRTPGEDLFVSLAVGGETNSVIVVKSPPAVLWQQASVTAPSPMQACSHGPNPGCSAGEAKQCVDATRPGGRFVENTWAITNRTTSDPSTYGENFEKRGSSKICVTMTQGTGACEVTQCAVGQLTAVETYPTVAE
ncbi:hypothetical protein RHAB21_02493 [Pseudorhizobium halotolerans]|uniref:Uncharacterized protein n=1 Tax=Pseudorhizobium halotolerans TaxID=1233081 RepID=A0ABM8PLA0_9HYPH|nr:hypothetical protein [Pseudorhizobium halotolerans]CAD7036186.1 hypothetical protein RHAB21_02493 [Pseudorhizobium halotolerans]